MASVFSRSFSGVADFEQVLGEQLPWASVVESLVVARSFKRMGRYVDESGRALPDVVPPSGFVA